VLFDEKEISTNQTNYKSVFSWNLLSTKVQKMQKYYDNQSSWTRIAFNPDYSGHVVPARFFTGRVLIAEKL
jgi:hypothetical protein